MAIKRPRITRVPNVLLPTAGIIDIAPDWKITLTSENHGPLELDFASMRSQQRDDLARHIRDAIWSMRFESELPSLASYYRAAKIFWKFLDTRHSSERTITRLDQVDRHCINQFLTWMELQPVPPGHRNAGQKLSVAARRNTYSGMKTLLINRQRRSPNAVSNNLDFPLNPFPRANLQHEKREPYSLNEHKRILLALHADLNDIYENGESALPILQLLIVHLLILASSTGANLQPLLELKRDSLHSHPLKDRELLFTAKRRGWTTFAISARKSSEHPAAQRNIHTVPTSIGDHFRALCNITQPLAQKGSEPLKEYAFLWVVSRGRRKGEIIRLSSTDAKTGIRDFSRRHKLLDDVGKPLALSFSRFRPTFATDLYRRTKDIRRVSQALGHSSVETTARYYVELSGDAIRDQSMVVEGMVAAFTRINIDGKLVIAADGGTPSSQVKFLSSEGYSTGIAHCRNPFRDDESVCKKFFTCFKCPNMMVFEDDLWRLFSFYFRLLAERPKLRPDHWLKTYGPIVKRIDQDISPLFSPESVELAKERAKSAPHPAWKEPL